MTGVWNRGSGESTIDHTRSAYSMEKPATEKVSNASKRSCQRRAIAGQHLADDPDALNPVEFVVVSDLHRLTHSSLPPLDRLGVSDERLDHIELGVERYTVPAADALNRTLSIRRDFPKVHLDDSVLIDLEVIHDVGEGDEHQFLEDALGADIHLLKMLLGQLV